MADVLKRNNVTIRGNGDETIIFGHGFGTDQSAWRHVAKEFDDNYRLVLFDTVGAGTTDPAYFSPNRYSKLEAYAEDLLQVCEAVDLKDAIMVAHSVSGMISLLAALKEPRRFKKIVMVGASPRYLNDEGYKGGFEQEDLTGFYHAMETNYFGWISGFAPLAMSNPERPELAKDFAQTLSEIRPDIAQSVSRTIFQSDYRKELPKLQTETLIIQASDDIAVPLEVGQYLHDHIPNSKLVNITATGHFPHVSAPEQVTDAIRSFI